MKHSARIFVIIFGLIYSSIFQTVDLPENYKSLFFEGAQTLALNLHLNCDGSSAGVSEVPPLKFDGGTLQVWLRQQDYLLSFILNVKKVPEFYFDYAQAFDSPYFPSRAPPSISHA